MTNIVFGMVRGKPIILHASAMPAGLKCRGCGGPMRSPGDYWLKPGEIGVECVKGCWCCEYCDNVHPLKQAVCLTRFLCNPTHGL